MTLAKLLDRLRALEVRRKEILASLRLPAEGLPGSLAPSRRRCGSQGCHCHLGEPHLSWTLTFMADGKKRVEHVPSELLDTVRARVEEGNAYKGEVAELMATNAQLLLLSRRARKQGEAAAKRRVGR
jgi:hypothetical protein